MAPAGAVSENTGRNKEGKKGCYLSWLDTSSSAEVLCSACKRSQTSCKRASVARNSSTESSSLMIGREGLTLHCTHERSSRHGQPCQLHLRIDLAHWQGSVVRCLTMTMRRRGTVDEGTEQRAHEGKTSFFERSTHSSVSAGGQDVFIFGYDQEHAAEDVWAQGVD